jgi:hypothetical protein
LYDWSKIRFLESTENLKSIVRQSSGRTPSTTAARDITACLQLANKGHDTRSLQAYLGHKNIQHTVR